MQAMANSFNKPFNGSALPPELLESVVKKGQATALFQFAMEFCKSFNEFHPSWDDPEEKEKYRTDIIESVKRQICEAIQDSHRHCGRPLTVQGAYDNGTNRHNLLIRCDYCGKATTIEENADYVN